MSSAPLQPAPARVLAALSPHEFTLFFPGTTPSALPEWSWFDPTNVTEQAWSQRLHEIQPCVVVSGWKTPRIPQQHTAAAGGSIQYVCNVTGSVRHVVTPEQIEAGLKVTNWGTLAAPIVAEHALLLTLAAARNLPCWPRVGSESTSGLGRFSTRTLFRKRIGLFGFGAIARALVDLLRPFQVEVAIYSHGVPTDLIKSHGAVPVETLSALFTRSEILICCESLTPRTQNSIDARMLALLPPQAIFVNVGRGALVREDDLAAAVRDQGLRVASDVFVEEPLPAHSAFWDLPSVLISPHIGGPTDDACPDCGRWAQENVARFTQGLPPIGLITPDVFERST